jgi:hypothetical protein
MAVVRPPRRTATGASGDMRASRWQPWCSGAAVEVFRRSLRVHLAHVTAMEKSEVGEQLKLMPSELISQHPQRQPPSPPHFDKRMNEHQEQAPKSRPIEPMFIGFSVALRDTFFRISSIPASFFPLSSLPSGRFGHGIDAEYRGDTCTRPLHCLPPVRAHTPHNSIPGRSAAAVRPARGVLVLQPRHAPITNEHGAGHSPAPWV